jgi:hypothetical protein
VPAAEPAQRRPQHAGGRHELDLELATAEQVQASWSGCAEIGWEAMIDGARFVVEIGRAGDHRFVHGDRCAHHLSADRGRLLCVPGLDTDSERRPANSAPDGQLLWWRVVLDSVLFTVALLAGREALHAGAVATPAGAVAITAAAGGGKSTLLNELLGRGLALLSDDVVVLQERANAAPLAHPGPPLMTAPSTLTASGGAVIASLGAENWVAMPVYPDALPLAALVILDRGAGRQTALQLIQAPLAPLLGSLLRFPHTSERERARFELAGALASHTPVWQLTADLTVTPSVLADTLADLVDLARPI